jgi:hypothetical protein
MKSKISMFKTIAITAILGASVSGIARADNDMNPFNGESYEYFKNAQAASSNAPSTFRQQYPNGLSQRELQALSSESPVWQLANPATTGLASANMAPSAWRQAHPHGLSERELQALSSESPVWQLPTESGPNTVATTSEAPVRLSAANRR